MKAAFICVENSNRSQMAEAYARMTGIDAYSAGSRPLGTVNPRAIDAMREVGYDLSVHESKSLNDFPAVTFDFVITMGCGDACPNPKAINRVNWQIPDPKNMESTQFRGVRDLIRDRVNALFSDRSERFHQI